MNSISFDGHIGMDPEFKADVGSGLLTFTVGSQVGWGERESTNWFRCNIWGTRSEKLSPYLQKGTKVFIIGELEIRKYEDKDGNEKKSVEVKVDKITFINKERVQREEDDFVPPSTPTPPQTPSTDEDMPF